MAIFLSKEEVVYTKWKYAEKPGKQEDQDICYSILKSSTAHRKLQYVPTARYACLIKYLNFLKEFPTRTLFFIFIFLNQSKAM